MNRKVRARREELNLTRAKLARQADVNRTTLIRLEEGKGDPRWSTLAKVASPLGLDPAELLQEATRAEGIPREAEISEKVTSLAEEALPAGQFLEELEAYIGATPLPGRRLTRAEWVRWCQAYLEHRRLFVR